jgi:hypothetical protein
MKEKVIGTLAAIVLMLALMFPVAMPAQQGSGGQAAGGQNTPAGKAQGQGRERHPEIREAIRQLNHAKQTLQRDAARDFGGHRANAVQEIDQAIAQLQQALQSDKQ